MCLGLPSSGLLGLPEAFVGLYTYAETEEQKHKCSRQNPFIGLLLNVQVS